MAGTPFPTLTQQGEPTRATLHAYSRAMAAIPRAHGTAHPRWWHVSLKVRPEGLVTDPIPLPGGGVLGLRMDPRGGSIVLHTSTGVERRFDMAAGMTGTEMGDAVIAAAAEHGLEGGYDRERLANDEPRVYDPEAAAGYFDAYTAAATVFERHRVSLGDRVGPIQVWPHGFDLAFEWFGTKTVTHDGEDTQAQLNLGLYPGWEPYVYSTPWPFDDGLTDTVLPDGSRWNTEGWQGAVLPYTSLAGAPDAEERLLGFARAVFDAASPGLGAS